MADYEPLLARRAIFFGTRTEHGTRIEGAAQTDGGLTLYQRVLGDAWPLLPETLRAMHSVRRSATVKGRADVRRGTNWLARLITMFIRFPAAGDAVPVEVRFDVLDGRETWTRRCADRSFSSIQSEGTGRLERLVCERFGPFTLGLALVVDERCLRLVVRGWDFLGIPLPRALAPRSNSHEHEQDGRFHFDVEISHPLSGLIVHYRGWLVPAS